MNYLSKSTTLRTALLLILLGFFMAQWFSFSPLLLLLSMGTGICLVQWENQWSRLLLVFLLSTNYALWTDSSSHNELESYENRAATLRGIVVSFPDQRIKTNRNYVKINEILAPSPPLLKKNSKILLVTNTETLLHYGTEIQFTGKLSKPRNFQDFDYQKYLDRFGVSHIIQSPESVEVLNTQKGLWVFRKAEKIRNTLERNLEQNLSSPHSTIAMGILLGVKRELPPPTKKDFQDSGLMHILVVSGFNISVIMIVCNYLFRHFGPRINLLLSIIVIGFFVLMTGAEAPVVRAAIMGSLVGLAISNGQFSESKNVLLLSAVLMGIINPKVIQADLGFFFSFAATAGIILLVPRLTPYFQWLTNRCEFRNVFLVTLASQIAVFPIQTYFFGRFPTGGLLANQLTEPVIPLAMLFSGLVSMFGFLPELMLKVVMIPAWFTLQILLSVAEIFSRFPTVLIPQFISIVSGSACLLFFLWSNLNEAPQKGSLQDEEFMIK